MNDFTHPNIPLNMNDALKFKCFLYIFCNYLMVFHSLRSMNILWVIFICKTIIFIASCFHICELLFWFSFFIFIRFSKNKTCGKYCRWINNSLTVFCCLFPLKLLLSFLFSMHYFGFLFFKSCNLWWMSFCVCLNIGTNNLSFSLYFRWPKNWGSNGFVSICQKLIIKLH